MANAVHLSTDNGATHRAALIYDFGAPVDHFYMRCQIYWSAASYSNWLLTHSFGPGIFLFSPTTTYGDFEQEIELTHNGLSDFWGQYWGPLNSSFPYLDVDTWHTFEIWVDARNPGESSWYKLDGTFGMFNSGTNPAVTGTFDARQLFLGYADVGSDGSAADIWVGKVDIGTAPGAHDILQYDPASTSYTPTFGTLLQGASTVAMATPPSPAPASMYGTPGSGSILASFAGDNNNQQVIGVGTLLDGTFQTTLYARFEFLLTSAQSAAIVSGMSSTELAVMAGNAWWYPNVSNNAALSMGLDDVSDPTYLDKFFVDTFSFSYFDGVPTPDVWHVVEMFYVKGGASSISIDGGTPFTFTGSTSTFYDGPYFFGIGVYFLSNGSPVSIWINRIKVGTTFGGGQILDYDPSVPNVLADSLLVAMDGLGDSVVFAVPPVAPPAPPLSSANLAGFGGTVPNPLSAVIDGAAMIVTFDNPLDPTKVPDVTQFNVNFDGSPVAVVGVSVPGGDTCGVSTATAPDPLAAVTLQYTKT